MLILTVSKGIEVRRKIALTVTMLSTEAKSVKIVFLGPSGSGKTSIVRRQVLKAFSDTMTSTIGASFLNTTVDYKGETIELSLWDTAGQEAYRSLAPMYYRNAKVAILVYDITDMESFNQLESWIAELDEKDMDILMVIVGNKFDLGEQGERAVSGDLGRKLASDTQALFFETSAKTGYGVGMMFQNIINRLFENNPTFMNNPQHEVMKLEEKGERRCC